ncbi:MAG: DUF4199 domain-containing protein [Bacteroidota bacterium]
MKKVTFRYGIIGGCISISLGLINWFTISQYYGPAASQLVGYFSIIISLMCVPLGIRYFRDTLNGGNISFAKAMKVGLGITGVFTTVSFVYGILFFVFAGDDFETWRKEGMTQQELEQLEAQMAQTPDFMLSPLFQGLLFVVTVFLIGLIIDVISSLVLKRSL